VERLLEVYREPAPSAEPPYGWSYRHVQRLSAEANVSPLAAPAASLSVTDLLPWRLAA
jgi:hypothetical protein